MRLEALLLLLILLLAACGEGEEAATPPAPVEPARSDIGYYCGMIIVDHPGPKAQIFLANREQPLWFTQVRDAIAFTRLPEEPRDIRAVWLNDMARAGSWEAPAPGAWIAAGEAWYVLGSDRRGGMGAPEAVPFGTEAAAHAFAAAHGGRVLRLDEIRDDEVLGGEPLAPAGGGG
ncbi:MAG TPA: nitrous oxide reductase accessory protein NosL [Geminicoccaceae bacterium]|nr:nitrous oxide reductase accessory protein NosL [Geminicoccaceae bacterium]